jgi:hypothetical protein
MPPIRQAREVSEPCWLLNCKQPKRLLSSRFRFKSYRPHVEHARNLGEFAHLFELVILRRQHRPSRIQEYLVACFTRLAEKPRPGRLNRYLSICADRVCPRHRLQMCTVFRPGRGETARSVLLLFPSHERDHQNPNGAYSPGRETSGKPGPRFHRR